MMDPITLGHNLSDQLDALINCLRQLTHGSAPLEETFTCPKCASEQVHVLFRAKGDRWQEPGRHDTEFVDGGSVPEAKKDFLELNCRRCGYSWESNTKDAPKQEN